MVDRTTTYLHVALGVGLLLMQTSAARGKEPTASAAAAIATALLSADGATDEEVVAAHLESLRGMAADASSVAPSIARLLKESSPLYRDRDKHEVQRLRAYVLVVLTEIGIPPSALPHLVDWLANSDRDMGFQFCAAARATGLLGPKARPLAPLLLDGMQRYYHRDEFSLQRYDPDYPRDEATSVQRESIRALGRIAGDTDQKVLERLNAYATGTHLDTRRYPDLCEEANRALRAITDRSKQPATETTSTGVNSNSQNDSGDNHVEN